MIEEEWRPVVGCEGAYEVSSHGQVRSLERWATFPSRSGTPSGRTVKGRILKQPRSAGGYPVVNINRYPRRVHALVAEAFLGPRPLGMDVCHADGDRTNNQVSNLRYDTRAGNMADAVKHGTVRTPNGGTEHHCSNGHAITPENTAQVFNRGRLRRMCLMCRRANKAAYQLRKDAAAS